MYYNISMDIFRMRNVSENFAEKVKTLIVCSITFFFFSKTAPFVTYRIFSNLIRTLFTVSEG